MTTKKQEDGGLTHHRGSGKIIIAGSGRAGTSFLVKLLTRLGFDTGIRPYEEHFSPETRAGCELWLDMDDLENLPYITKAPILSFSMRKVIESTNVECVIIPIRNINVAAESRIDVDLHWDEPSYMVNPKLDDLAKQTILNAMAIGFTVEACVVTGTKFVIMRFPDFVKIKGYCHSCLSKAGLPVDSAKFSRVFDKTVDLNLIKFKG